MCSTSTTCISPIRITSHRSICCNQHLLSSNNSNKSCVQQSSTIQIEPNLYKCCGCCGVMFSELSKPAGMPRFLVCTVYLGSRNGPRMHLVIVADWRAWYWGSYSPLSEPITGHGSFDVYLEKYAAVHTGMQNLG